MFEHRRSLDFFVSDWSRKRVGQMLRKAPWGHWPETTFTVKIKGWKMEEEKPSGAEGESVRGGGSD